MNKDIAFLHGRKMVLVKHMSMGGIKGFALDHKQSVIRHDGEIKHHLVHLCITVSPNRINFILHGI